MITVKLIAVTQPLDGKTPEEFLASIGRLCYKSQRTDSPGDFLRRRIEEGHESIIEHLAFTFHISGISRVCSHQLVRHRIASYTQVSQRYVDHSNAVFTTPESFAHSGEAWRAWNEFLGRAKKLYRFLLEHSVKREDARFVLPQAVTTEIIVTMNARELRHFFKLRCSPRAQWEIRLLAKKMLKLAYEVAPNLFQDLCEKYIGALVE